MMQNYKVYAYCATFNHSKYIKDTLNGFCMQQTEFPFVCAIKDDASTDGEQEVIKQYLKENFNLDDKSVSIQKETEYGYVTYAQHKTNKNCFFAVVLLKENHYSQKKDPSPYFKEWRNVSEYIALCEGDDYWIDPLKLQKQVDFLDSHPNCTLVGTNGVVLWDGGVKRPSYFSDIHQSRELTPEYIMTHWAIPTASVMYRTELKLDYPDWTNMIYSGDLTLMLIAMSKGSIYCFSDLTCVYRKVLGSNSASNIADANRTYVIDQHQLLYTEFDKWTNGRYHELIKDVLHKGELEKRYIKLKRKSILIAIIMMPSYAFNKYVEKYKKLKNLIEKR